MNINPLLVAHRGDMTNAPENTDAAFRQALTHNVDGIEFDVQLSSDGIPVIYHDETLYKINGTNKHIADYRFSALKKMDWGSWYATEFAGAPILTLEQLLKKYSGKTSLLIEIKSRPADHISGRSQQLTKLVMNLLKRYVARKDLRNTYILSFDMDVLAQVHKTCPAQKCILNIDDIRTINGLLPNWLTGCGVALRKLSQDLTSYLHSMEMIAMTYSCNTPRQLKKALNIGADIILSDNPGWLIKYISKRACGSSTENPCRLVLSK